MPSRSRGWGTINPRCRRRTPLYGPRCAGKMFTRNATQTASPEFTDAKTGLCQPRFHRLSIKIVGETVSAALSCSRQADENMKRSRIFLGLLVLGILMAAVPANALEGKAPVWRYNAHSCGSAIPSRQTGGSRMGVGRLLVGLWRLLCLGIGRLPEGRYPGPLPEIH